MIVRKWKIKFDVPTTVFFVITAISVGFVVFPLWNYNRFYLALWNFDYNLSNVAIDPNQVKAIQLNEIDEIQINVTLLVINPTDYSGLEVRSVAVGLKYFEGEHMVLVPSGPRGVTWVTTNWWDLKVGSDQGKHPVGSNSNITVLLPITVTPNSNVPAEQSNARAFINFLNTRPVQIVWSLTCILVVSSFMGNFDVSRVFAYVTSLV